LMEELTSVFLLEFLEQPSMAMAKATAIVPDNTAVAGMLTAQRRRIACITPPVFFVSNEVIFAMFVSPPPAAAGAMVNGTAGTIPQVIDYEIVNGETARTSCRMAATLWVG